MNFTTQEYNARLTNVKSKMSEKGLDVLILSDPSNMNYLTGYDGWSFYVPQVVIISLDKDQPIWFGRKQDSNGARITTFLKNENILGYPEKLIQSPPSHPFDYLSIFIKENKWENKNIGVEMDSYYYTAECHNRLLNHCPNANFKNGYLLVNWIRYIKSDSEIAYMKEAAKLVQAGMRTAYNEIKPDIKQSFVAGKIQQTLLGGNEDIQIGGEYSGLNIILASGESASASHLTPTDKKLKQDEGTIIELGGVKNRYHCALSRTVYIGKPDPKITDTLKITNEGVEKAIEATKPGNSCHDVAVAFWKVLEKYGVEKESRCGYSIGIGYPPDWGEHTLSIRKNEMTILRPNVTYHLMAGMWMDTWGLEISESIRVTESGAELFCNFPRELHLI
ncbi:MAG: Ectoine hydrolase [Alphaproteobacteria bacterium MarineAlpha5_Bin9]|nr:MAG: Ectoine hydrolase [Alphaproteobacteria bacterium MarineAlpha5_Bin9]|tara:strand:+ start:214 stop:1386 length:1173 start_codon:yes stop_codon:yes gene_type:complete